MAKVRTPHPLNMSGANQTIRDPGRLSTSTMPVHKQCPTLDVTASIGRLSPSSPIASIYRPRPKSPRLNAVCRRSALPSSGTP